MKDSSIWLDIQEFLKSDISESEMAKWIRPLQLKSLKGDKSILVAPNRFVKSWVEDNYLPAIKKAFYESLSNKSDIYISLEDDRPSTKIVSLTKTVKNEEESKFALPLNKKYTFSTFVVGASNRYAHAACVSITSGQKKINPLYIYGDVGLGKTHLMHAVGNAFVDNFPKYRILYTTGESFVNDYVDSMRHNHIDSFKNRYRNIDILLFDDVQYIAGKEKTMEEFFYTFSQLYATQKQIILTSNMPPNSIKELDPRLSSRFAAGLMLDISAPSVEEKEAILRKYIEFEGLAMPQESSDDIIRYLANNIKSDNTRAMLGATLRMFTLASIDNEDVTIPFAEKHLKDFLINRDKTLSPDTIVDITSKYYQLKVSDLKSKNRSKTVARARSVAMFLLREKLSLSLTEISSIFSRDHTTALHAINKITDLLPADQELQGTIDALIKKMKLIN